MKTVESDVLWFKHVQSFFSGVITTFPDICSSNAGEFHDANLCQESKLTECVIAKGRDALSIPEEQTASDSGHAGWETK